MAAKGTHGDNNPPTQATTTVFPEDADDSCWSNSGSNSHGSGHAATVCGSHGRPRQDHRELRRRPSCHAPVPMVIVVDPRRMVRVGRLDDEENDNDSQTTQDTPISVQFHDKNDDNPMTTNTACLKLLFGLVEHGLAVFLVLLVAYRILYHCGWVVLTTVPSGG